MPRLHDIFANLAGDQRIIKRMNTALGSEHHKEEE